MSTVNNTNVRQLLSKNDKKVVEKVENRGTFRIVGQVFQDKNSKTALGYGIIDVKNCQLRLFTTKQTLELLKRYKFENAEINEKDKIINTECSMDRLIKFDTKQNVIGNAGITILGQVILNGKDYGYRVLNQYGKVDDITEETLLMSTKNGDSVQILNAKVIKEGVAKPYVSAIKGEFKRIEISEFEQLQTTYKNGKTVEEMHKKYLEKVKIVFAKKLRAYGYVRLMPSNKCRKDSKIIMNEYISIKYPFINKESGIGVSEAITLALLIDISDGTFDKYKVGGFGLFSRNVGKYTSLVPKFTKKVIELAKSNGHEDVADTMLFVNNILNGKARSVKTCKTKSILENGNLYYYARMFINRNVREKEDTRETYNPMDLDYESVQGIEVLGYTINKDNVGKPFTSVIYGSRKGNPKPITFRWLLEGVNTLPCDEDFILDNINCFGDVELMRRIISNYKLLLNPRYGTAEGYKLKAEAYLFVLACNNITLAKYVNNMCNNFSELQLEDINREKFNLDSDDRLFYLSGGKFNRSVKLTKGGSWSNPSDKNGSLSSFTGGYFAAMSLYMTIDGKTEHNLVE